MAMVESSSAPLLLIGGDLAVIAASRSFCNVFQIDPASIDGRRLSGVGSGEWDVPQLAQLLRITASGQAEVDAYEMDLERDGVPSRRLVLNARKLDYDGAVVRLLVAVTDVTDVRANDRLKDALIREKAILLQELQHRVANSLQIIASVLMQSARVVQSDETRGHLYDAHHRILSVASVQRQLAVSSLSNVELRPYLRDLCQSIGASMIRDRAKISLEVSIDDSATSPEASVSIGLIVTELVINALKHAFPGLRQGKIVVTYRTHSTGWTLSVSDNGVGMPTDPDLGKPGLGTGIVTALAQQLGASVATVDADPGTLVSIALIETDRKAGPAPL
ncbi:MAG: ATP-binding protein [Bauldia sp.]|nr:ATP-binding protein [Bauldia sp.]